MSDAWGSDPSLATKAATAEAHPAEKRAPGSDCIQDIGQRPRQDSNLRHRLRRPVLYPLSYGGGRYRAGDDRTRHAARALSALTGRANAAVSCISMPTDHDVATAPLERHLLPRSAAVDEKGHLHLGGIDLLELVEQFGTPLFVYDEEHLRHACREAVAAWGDGVAYATKAFLCLAMARLAHEEGMHLDVASGGELHVALSAGVPPERLILHGNNKSIDELATALRLGVGRIVIDSFDEIARLGGLLESTPPGQDRPKVLVRVTPGVEAHTHEFVRTGQEDSKFGFSVSSGAASEAVAALELCPASSWPASMHTSAARSSTHPPSRRRRR